MIFKELENISERLTTEKYKNFGYSLKNYGSDNLVGLYREYDVFWEHQKSIYRLGYLEDLITLRNVEEWYEDMGDCLWWRNEEIEEPPIYIGSPLCDDWNDELRYFIQIPNPIIKKEI